MNTHRHTHTLVAYLYIKEAATVTVTINREWDRTEQVTAALELTDTYTQINRELDTDTQGSSRPDQL